MGKTKKKFNWKAREAVETIIDKNEERKVQIFAYNVYELYFSPLILC